jgi:hypothetical protein
MEVHHDPIRSHWENTNRIAAAVSFQAFQAFINQRSEPELTSPGNVDRLFQLLNEQLFAEMIEVLSDQRMWRSLVLHADVLAADVRTAWARFREELQTNATMRASATNRLAEILESAEKDAEKNLGPLLRQQAAQARNPAAILPPRWIAPSGIATTPGSIQVNSPAPGVFPSGSTR